MRSNVVERELGRSEILIQLREVEVLGVELLGKLSPDTRFLLLNSVADVSAIGIVGADDFGVESAGNGGGVSEPAGEWEDNTHECPNISVSTVTSFDTTSEHLGNAQRDR